MTSPEPTAAQRERVHEIVATWLPTEDSAIVSSDTAKLEELILLIIAAETAPLLAALDPASRSCAFTAHLRSVSLHFNSEEEATAFADAWIEFKARAAIKRAKEG